MNISCQLRPGAAAVVLLVAASIGCQRNPVDHFENCSVAPHVLGNATKVIRSDHDEQGCEQWYQFDNVDQAAMRSRLGEYFKANGFRAVVETSEDFAIWMDPKRNYQAIFEYGSVQEDLSVLPKDGSVVVVEQHRNKPTDP